MEQPPSYSPFHFSDEEESNPELEQDNEHGPENAPETGDADGDGSGRPFKGSTKYKHLLHGDTWGDLYGEKEFPDPQKV